jgi:hypothetical protein
MNINPSTLYKLIALVGVFSAVLAAGISALFQLINGWRERLAADRRHLKDLALKAAIVQWEYDVSENKLANSNLTMGAYPRSLSEVDFDMILVKKLKLIDTFGKSNLSEEDIALGIREMGVTADAIKKGTYPKQPGSR